MTLSDVLLLAVLVYALVYVGKAVKSCIKHLRRNG